MHLQANRPRRGATRRYNRLGYDKVIITTRMSEAEYDILHAVAAATRVSVSVLLLGMIYLWENAVRKNEKYHHLTNYSYSVKLGDGLEVTERLESG